MAAAEQHRLSPNCLQEHLDAGEWKPQTEQTRHDSSRLGCVESTGAESEEMIRRSERLYPGVLFGVLTVGIQVKEPCKETHDKRKKTEL